MNFYRLRFINTLFLFIIGILLGFYFASKNNFFKKVFSNSDYKPVYYGKDLRDSYTPVYLKSDLKNNSYQNTEFGGIDKTTKEEKKFVENIAVQNPIDDDYDFVIVASSDFKQQNEEFFEVSNFVKSPDSFVFKKISGNMILLKGEKENGVKLYFLVRLDNQAFYVDVEDEDKIIKNFDSFKIGYYYNVTFISQEGSVRKGNKLLSIEETQKKEPWASGLSAF
ncbi:MAG TPA: hypothetical protein PK103_04850 [Elusimicrobiales bacterium]|nr:hypothetical protein [Elusimicrobiales bacterium]HOL62680.1 hypothetical protein [Elusimicrobiales bacterium]HPO95017.1 hypothetical protein [Elusimicrobiales bacterium]